MSATQAPAADAASLTDSAAPDLAWSYNQEDWQHESLEELLQYMHDQDGLEEGMMVWFGEKHRPNAREFAPDSDYITERMNENAGDSEGGEWAEDFATKVDAAALKELDSYLEEWAEKHCPVTWWLIEKTTEYTITAEDVASVVGDLGQGNKLT